MQREYYRFGGVTFAIEADAPIERSAMCAPFHAADGAPEHTIRLHFDDWLPVPPETAQNRGAVWRWQSGAERHLLEQYGTPDKPPRFTYAVTRGAHTEVTFANAYRAGASVRAVLEAAGLFDIFAARGMLVLHSAYIVTSAGEAILFSGPSGVGKSTQAALWERCAGARVVNGDRALVDVGKKTANGIFYSGTSGISENVTAPVRAIVLLGQGSENRVFVPSPQAAFAGVLSQCAYYEWDARSAEQMTECVARLVSDVPVLRMDCLPDATAVEALRGKLGGI